jgi:hypothetical protein
MGVCMGVHYAYGSYNHIKKPVILDSFFISFIGFFFSFLVGFMAWGAIGYLNANNDSDQKQTSSVGLTYIAMPKAASMYDGVGTYTFFLVFMFCTGITQVYAFVLGFITNLTDYFHCATWKASLGVTIFGLVATTAYTSNSGWVLFDMTEHYILSYIVIIVGFLQCVSAGWYFEYYSTAAVSVNHAKSLRTLAVFYWIPVIVITFYANFGLTENKIFGLVAVVPFVLLSMIVSFSYFKREGFDSWYHEICLQGVDKLSMSITSLSNPNGERSFWMMPFETYFGMSIKFINPACLLFILFNNLYEDMSTPYGSNTDTLTIFATIPVFAAILIIIIPIFTCARPEIFQHDVNQEFMADNLYEKKLRLARQAEFTELQKLNVNPQNDEVLEDLNE